MCLFIFCLFLDPSCLIPPYLSPHPLSPLISLYSPSNHSNSLLACSQLLRYRGFGWLTKKNYSILLYNLFVLISLIMVFSSSPFPFPCSTGRIKQKILNFRPTTPPSWGLGQGRREGGRQWWACRGESKFLTLTLGEEWPQIFRKTGIWEVDQAESHSLDWVVMLLLLV